MLVFGEVFVLVRGLVVFVHQAWAALRRDMRHIAIGVCLFLHTGHCATRIVAFIAAILLLPNIVIFAPNVLVRCASFQRFKRR